MKILYFFPEYDTPMFSWQRIHFIDELSRHGIEFVTFNPLLFNTPEEANEQFIKLLGDGKYDLLLSSVCYPGMIFPEVLSTAKKRGLPSLCIRWDNLTIPFFDEQQASKFDLLWLTAYETEYLYKKWGANYIIQPYAANPYSFNYQEQTPIRKVCFIGTPYGSRSLMINELTRNQVSVNAYYGGVVKQKSKFVVKYSNVTPSRTKILFDRLRFSQGRKIMLGMIVNKMTKQQKIENNAYLEHFSAVTPSELSGYYSQYVLSLASTSTNHTDALRNPLKIINLRNFEIPMSGGIEICKYNNELAEYFEEGKEIVFYKDDEELIEKSKYFTKEASDSEIFKIKQNARIRASKEHSWWCRFTKTFDALGLKYDK